MTPLEGLMTDKKPSFIFGFGYTGPEKPSDISTAGYLLMWFAAFGYITWVVFHG